MVLLIEIKDKCEWVNNPGKKFSMGTRFALDDWEQNNCSPWECTDFRDFSRAREMVRYELLAGRIRKVVEDFYSSEEMEVIISTKSM